MKEPGAFAEGRYSMKWLVAIFIMQVYSQINLTASGRFLSVKDGREGQRAAWLAFGLMVIGSVLWVIPPMVARFLHADEVMALGGKTPGELAYSHMAKLVLPTGMMGPVVAAMFAATWSSMDTGLNNHVGIIVRNMIPRLRKAFGRVEPLSEKTGLFLCKVLTVVMGVVVVGYALVFSARKELVLFEAYFVISTTVGIPLALPTLAGLWFKSMPRWSYFLVAGACLVPSTWFVIDSNFNGATWTIQDRTLWIFAVGTVATLLACALRRFESPEAREETAAFFREMRTPVDFAREVGEDRDRAQCLMIGRSCVTMGAVVLLLLFTSENWFGRVCVLGLAAFIAAVGGALLLEARRLAKREALQKSATESESPFAAAANDAAREGVS